MCPIQRFCLDPPCCLPNVRETMRNVFEVGNHPLQPIIDLRKVLYLKHFQEIFRTMPQRFEDLTGQRFGRLVALRKYEIPSKVTRWVCVCDCGNETRSFKTALKRGQAQSCGCLRRELSSQAAKLRKTNLKHGLSKTPEYGVWLTMRRRCDDPNVEKFQQYGGRGIKVCERWQKFENFISDMGRRPGPEFSIERLDNDGNYEPSNCRWETVQEQSYNKSTTRLLSYKGQEITVHQASKVAGIPKNNIFARLYRGWSVERAIEEPLRRWPT
jgi:hypothetical protein